MSPSEVRLLAIAGPPAVPLERLVDRCRAAADGGATAVQLRTKNTPAGAQLRYAEALVTALEIPVYVNDRPDIAWAAGARGVHLGADDLPAIEVRRAFPAALRIGVSVGSRDEAVVAAGSAVDYWSIGSVYATATKPDAGTPIGPTGFRELSGLAPPGTRVIAIGGVTAADVADLVAAGAQGVAVSGAIFTASDIEAAARAIRRAIDAVLPVAG